jgi:hypothetical protein
MTRPAPTILRWEAPPPRPTQQALAATALGESTPRWQPVIDALHRQPGEWAVVHEGPRQQQASQIAWYIRSGSCRGFILGDYEAEARRTPAGYATYVRYVGDDDG